MGSEGSGASRGGGDEFHNEDTFLVEQGLGLYAVCDGASGSPAGEIAAHLAIDAVKEYVARAESNFGSEVWQGPDRFAVIHNGLRYALGSVLKAAQKHAELAGMSTTITMLLVHGDQGVIGHAGDSRIYLIRRGRGSQLTLDHELTDSLPVDDASDFEIDSFGIPLEPHDTLILCTDGAEDVVEEPDIVRVAGSLSPALLASRIVAAAHRRNSRLDATVVVVRVRGEAEQGWLELSTAPRELSFGHAVAFANSELTDEDAVEDKNRERSR